MPASETVTKRHFPASDFGATKMQPCLHPSCNGVMVIEGKFHPRFYRLGGRTVLRRQYDPGLREGDVWLCTKCRTPHEFYLEYVSGPGGSLRTGTVRAFVPGSVQERDKGEPTPGEFVE